MQIKPDGRTTCCNAFTTIFTDDGVEYCKGCFEAVDPPSASARTIINLKEAP